MGDRVLRIESRTKLQRDIPYRKIMSILIGSGYCHGQTTGERERAEQFLEIWKLNTQLMGDYDIVILANAGCYPDLTFDHLNDRTSSENIISLPNNLGHVAHLLNGKNVEFCGWSAVMISLAMLAYTNECDFVYKEQDCLCFGPVIETMENELGSAGMIFGNCLYPDGVHRMPAAQSLFMVRHGFIPEFVRRYLGMGKDGDPNNLPEHKFKRLEDETPDKVKRFSFGVDRGRPLPIGAPVWYAQQLTDEELEMLRNANLI